MSGGEQDRREACPSAPCSALFGCPGRTPREEQPRKHPSFSLVFLWARAGLAGPCWLCDLGSLGLMFIFRWGSGTARGPRKPKNPRTDEAKKTKSRSHKVKDPRTRPDADLGRLQQRRAEMDGQRQRSVTNVNVNVNVINVQRQHPTSTPSVNVHSAQYVHASWDTPKL